MPWFLSLECEEHGMPLYASRSGDKCKLVEDPGQAIRFDSWVEAEHFRTQLKALNPRNDRIGRLKTVMVDAGQLVVH